MAKKNFFKNLIGIEELDEEDFDITEEEIEEAKKQILEAEEEEEEKEEKPSKQKKDKKKDTEMLPPLDSMTDNYSKRERTYMTTTDKYSAATTMNGTGSMKLIVIEPQNFEECKTLVESLKKKKPIIINLEKLETETAKKIFDFLSGAICALEGTVTKVTNNIFIFAPKEVKIKEQKDNSRDTGKPENIWK